MAKTETSKRVGIWIRVSTEDQVRGESPETHERRARAYAESRDWTVVEVCLAEALRDLFRKHNVPVSVELGKGR